MAPRYEPTERTRGKVEALAAYGHTEPQIAVAIGVSERTLRNHYKAELATAHDALNARMAQTLADIALGRNEIAEGEKRDTRSQVSALIFWLKSRARWRTEHKIELDGIPANAGAPVVVILPDNGRDHAE